MLKFILNVCLVAVTCINFCYSQDFCDVNLPNCNRENQFRLMNGRCNNVNNGLWGASQTNLLRMARPRYADGRSSPPRSTTGAALPSARLLSITLFGDRRVPDTRLTLNAMQIAHLLAHDMAFTVGNDPVNGCCVNRTIVSNPDRFCFAIPIPPGDAVHPGRDCMNFNRNRQDIDNGCPNYQGDGVGQQINRVTAYLDLSAVYGHNNNNANNIRLFRDGRLLTETRNGAAWPPANPNRNACDRESPSEPCYLGGDPRINATPQLSIMTILFIREHNRIADTLRSMNPSWNDEKLFQEARRINIAQYQYIIYYEFLPQILGLNNMKNAGLYVRNQGGQYVDDYNPNVNAGIINEFTGSAFRYFHTQIAGILQLISEQRVVTGSYNLSTVMDRPMFVEQGNNFQSFTRGLVTQPSESRDMNVDFEIQTAFKGNFQNGRDLKAMDIQRDRDHGIASYNDMRVAAGLRRARNFNDLTDVMSPPDAHALERIYATVDDIDLSVGGDMERARDHTVSHGPTYHHIFMQQFRNSRVGDRYWFESSTGPYPFTTRQLAEIRRASFSRIICDNSNGVENVQPNSFLLPNNVDNALVRCNRLPVVDLSLWRGI